MNDAHTTNTQPRHWPPDDTLIAFGEPITLLEPVHSEVRSVRWRGLGGVSGDPYDVLFVRDGESLNPILDDQDASLSGWTFARVDVEGGEALVFPMKGVAPLEDALERPELPEHPTERLAARHSDRQRRFEVIFALGEMFEILHEIAEGLVVHAHLKSFVLRRKSSGDGFDVLFRCPELLYPRDAPPQRGSFKGTGFDAPEVTGVISRPIDARADVYMMGMLTFTLFTGISPSPGLENLTHLLPSVRAFDNGAPIGLERALRRALARSPEDRFEGVGAFLDALLKVHKGHQRRLTTGPDTRVWISYGACSEIGRRKRERYPVNQDTYLELFDPDVGWGLFAVMDGVSRSDIGNGELASWLTRTTLEEGWNLRRKTPIYGRVFEGDSPFPTNLLVGLAQRAHVKVFDWLELLLRDPEVQRGGRSLATTLSAVGIFRNRCAVCTVGDSPIYLVRLAESSGGAFIERLTVDQTAALYAIRRGKPITEALTMASASSLSAAIGRSRWRRGDETIPERLPLYSEQWSFRLHPGDLLLLCSDGVPNAFGAAHEETMFRILTEQLDPTRPQGEAQLVAAARRLVREADARGGRDNLTAIVIAIEPART